MRLTPGGGSRTLFFRYPGIYGRLNCSPLFETALIFLFRNRDPDQDAIIFFAAFIAGERKLTPAGAHAIREHPEDSGNDEGKKPSNGEDQIFFPGGCPQKIPSIPCFY